MKLTLLAALCVGASVLPVQAAQTTPAIQTTPVIVELFTSEGCSSCPPADALLSRYIKSSPVSGVEVIALGEHVEYWNRGGWADPFSSATFTSRQSDYSRAFHLDTVFTPQAVIDGEISVNGSDDDATRAAIRRASKLPKASVSVTQAGVGRLSVQISHLPSSALSDHTAVFLAVTEDSLSSHVAGGENAGRHLVHSAVVRSLTPIGTIIGGAFAASPTVTLKSGWRRGQLHAVVFAQEQGSRRIVGAAEISL